ncbi:hypothetical protein PENARI_c026G01143 [Penicillium arizonense]|uniref:Uncharacterized protein n=1 Tax=Penicillium arizonense TaxID=1835702 RepID=A0A1F5L723_PENAI|nr:hypothetical protein PENARI_c026G01143 [Penicillium arizonense]
MSGPNTDLDISQALADLAKYVNLPG